MNELLTLANTQLSQRINKHTLVVVVVVVVADAVVVDLVIRATPYLMLPPRMVIHCLLGSGSSSFQVRRVFHVSRYLITFRNHLTPLPDNVHKHGHKTFTVYYYRYYRYCYNYYYGYYLVAFE